MDLCIPSFLASGLAWVLGGAAGLGAFMSIEHTIGRVYSLEHLNMRRALSFFSLAVGMLMYAVVFVGVLSSGESLICGVAQPLDLFDDPSLFPLESPLAD